MRVVIYKEGQKFLRGFWVQCGCHRSRGNGCGAELAPLAVCIGSIKGGEDVLTEDEEGADAEGDEGGGERDVPARNDWRAYRGSKSDSIRRDPARAGRTEQKSCGYARIQRARSNRRKRKLHVRALFFLVLLCVRTRLVRLCVGAGAREAMKNK